MMRVAFAIVGIASCAATFGCSEPTGPRTVASQDMAVKVPAIIVAVENQDRSAVPQLVKDLESDDAALRMFAIMGLQELTGQDFGYVYYADVEQRRPAVMKWRQWLEQQQPQRQPTARQRAAATRPSTK